MSNRLEHLLAIWQQQKDACEWVLATIVDTAGSSYRKPGAMMLINSFGQYYGLLSGGCLESDLMRQAKRCMASNSNLFVTYDMREDSDIAWQIGIGCGGMVKILLQQLSSQNNYLHLEYLDACLKQKQPCIYSINLDSLVPDNAVKPVGSKLKSPATASSHDHFVIDSSKQHKKPTNYFQQVIKPTPLIGIFGGGVDAKPVCDMAITLGWQVVIIDERVNYGQPKQFSNATFIFKQKIESVIDQPWFHQLDAIAIMTHNVTLDGRALQVAQHSNAKYVGLLGPAHRTDKVFASIELTRQNLTLPLSNPIGLEIGGELPESIALSILAEAHAVLENKLVLNTGHQNNFTPGLQHVS